MKIFFLRSPLTYCFVIGLFFFFIFVNIFISSTNIYKYFFFHPKEPRLHSAVLSLFFHASFSHLFSNLLFLLFFGKIVEYKLGVKKWLLFFFFAGFISIFSDAMIRGFILNDPLPIVGTSGAISGLAAISALVSPFTLRIANTVVPFPVFLIAWTMLYLDISNLFMNSPIAHWAHLAGFFSVLVSVYLLTPQERKKIQFSFFLNLVFFILSVVILFFYKNFSI